MANHAQQVASPAHILTKSLEANDE
jgi:hypothetical protein